MANALAELFDNIAESIRGGLPDAGKMKPVTFPNKIDEIVGLIGTGGGGSGEVTEGVDPYYQRLAESLITRNAEDLSGDKTTLPMKGFVTSSGKTLASVNEYAFAGFVDVENIIISDTLFVYENAFAGCKKLKILDVTASSAIGSVGFFGNSLSGCTALESVIVRDGGCGIERVNFNKHNMGGTDLGGVGANDTFCVYVPAAYYDTIIANVNSSSNIAVPASRYRKLEDYPAVDKWNETYTVNFCADGKIVDTTVVKYGQTATTAYSKEGYKIAWEPSNANITQDTNCYAQFSLDAPFATASFDALGEVLRSGNVKLQWNVGDKRNVPITLSDGTDMIAPFEIRETGDDYVILISQYAYASALWGSDYSLNTSTDNYWAADGGWRSAYNETLYNGLPADMAELIAVRQNVSTRNTTTNGSVNLVTDTTNDKIWIPSNDEMNEYYSSNSARVKMQQTATSVGTAAVQYCTRDGRSSAYVRPSYVTAAGAIVSTGTGSPYSVKIAPIAMMLKVTE